MKKILLNRKPIEGPWGGGNLFVKAIFSNAVDNGYEVVTSFEESPDVILMIDPRYDEMGISINEIISYKNKNPKALVVHRVNECDVRKGTNDIDNILLECSKFTDITIFVSNWIKNYFIERGWFNNSNFVIYNGVNKEHFRLNKNKNNEKVRICAHHWSNNRLKGFDIYDKLDKWVGNHDGYEFVYIGRELGSFQNAIVVSPLFGKSLGDELSQANIYVSASRFDPGPNHIIEALACEIPTFVHMEGGGAVEFAGFGAVYSSFEDLILRIQKKEFPNQHGWNISWEDCAKYYFELINKHIRN